MQRRHHIWLPTPSHFTQLSHSHKTKSHKRRREQPQTVGCKPQVIVLNYQTDIQTKRRQLQKLRRHQINVAETSSKSIGDSHQGGEDYHQCSGDYHVGIGDKQIIVKLFFVSVTFQGVSATCTSQPRELNRYYFQSGSAETIINCHHQVDLFNYRTTSRQRVTQVEQSRYKLLAVHPKFFYSIIKQTFKTTRGQSQKQRRHPKNVAETSNKSIGDSH